MSEGAPKVDGEPCGLPLHQCRNPAAHMRWFIENQPTYTTGDDAKLYPDDWTPRTVYMPDRLWFWLQTIAQHRRDKYGASVRDRGANPSETIVFLLDDMSAQALREPLREARKPRKARAKS